MSKAFAALALVGVFTVNACGGQAEPDSPLADLGGEQATAPGQDIDPQTMALITEAQQLDQQLAAVREAAMQDGELAEQLEEIQIRVEAAMREENPELVQRMDDLEAEFVAAQQAGDQERVQAIGMAAQGIQLEFQALQESVFNRPDIREPIDTFEDAQREKMIEIDPESEEIMDRLDEIVAQLQIP